MEFLCLLLNFVGIIVGALALASILAHGFTFEELTWGSIIVGFFSAVLRIALTIIGANCLFKVTVYFGGDIFLALWLMAGITSLIYWKIRAREAKNRKIDENSVSWMQQILKHKLIEPQLSEIPQSALDSAILDIKLGDHGGYISQPPHSLEGSEREIALSVMWSILQHKTVSPHLKDVPEKELKRTVLEIVDQLKL